MERLQLHRRSDAFYVEFLVRRDGSWVPNPRIVELFGTNILPSPFTANADPSQVANAISLRNPGVEVALPVDEDVKGFPSVGATLRLMKRTPLALPVYAPKMLKSRTITHEEFVQSVRALALDRAPLEVKRALEDVKLVYGHGDGRTRGICYYDHWKANGQSLAFLEIHAAGEESVVQLAGTTLHEMGHALAVRGAGHAAPWKAACAVLGLNAREAGGQDYRPDDFAPDLWEKIVALPRPSDGVPTCNGHVLPGIPLLPLPGMTVRVRPCNAGWGTRGGTSRGPGSGSRLRLFTCDCGTKVRASRDDLDWTCNSCGTKARLVVKEGAK